MSDPYDPYNAPTAFPGGGQQPPPPPPPPQPTQQFPQPPQPPQPTQQFPQPPQQQYPPQPPPPPGPGGGYGAGPGGPGFGAPGGYGAPGFGGPPPTSRTPLIIGAVVLALVLVAGAVGGFFLLTGDDDPDTDKASDDSSQTDEPSESEEPSEEPTSEEPVEEPTEPVTEQPAEPADPGGGFDPALTPVVGLWEGTYTCAQGDSKLDLAIAPSSTEDGALDAVFEFGPTDSNPQVPEGSFLMAGYFTGGTLALNGYQWIEQPPDYVFVDLLATVDGELPDTIAGEITTAGCSSFTVSRTTG